VALNTINQTKPRDQCAQYGFIRGVTSADVMCYIIRHYRLRFIFNLLSADMNPHPPYRNWMNTYTYIRIYNQWLSSS